MYNQSVSMLKKTIAELIFNFATFLMSAVGGTQRMQLVRKPINVGKRATSNRRNTVSQVKKQNLKAKKKRKPNITGKIQKKQQRLPVDVGKEKLIVAVDANHVTINEAREDGRTERIEEPHEIFEDWTEVKRKKRVQRNNSKKFLMRVEKLHAAGILRYEEEQNEDDATMCRYCKHIRPPVDYNHPLYSPTGEILCTKFGSCFICGSKSHTPKYCVYNPVLKGQVANIFKAGPGSLDDSVIREIRRLLPTSVPCRFCLERGPGAFSHSMQNESGEVVCPVLSSLTCPHCGATGADAHTAKYCPYRPPQRTNLSPNVDE